MHFLRHASSYDATISVDQFVENTDDVICIDNEATHSVDKYDSEDAKERDVWQEDAVKSTIVTLIELGQGEANLAGLVLALVEAVG